jgi:peptidyl-tRNA hydrolase
MHRNTKYWSLTWQTNLRQKKIPDEHKLTEFMNYVCTTACFQYEQSPVSNKIHIQGAFTLDGTRRSKTAVLELFKESFKNVKGLTISPVYDKFAVQAYVTKSEGRVKGPFYVGNKELFEMNSSKSKLRDWQLDLYNILTSEKLEELKDRKVIWVQDVSGNTGKSWFQKWLRIGQKKLTVRSLPVSTVDRLLAAVHQINRTEKVDIFNIDLARTQGEEESFENLFSAIEQIKNGFVIDLMYGKYHESYFAAPVVMIFTNQKIERFKHYLSEDRWKVFTINEDGQLIESPDFVSKTER